MPILPWEQEEEDQEQRGAQGVPPDRPPPVAPRPPEQPVPARPTPPEAGGPAKAPAKARTEQPAAPGPFWAYPGASPPAQAAPQQPARRAQEAPPPGAARNIGMGLAEHLGGFLAQQGMTGQQAPAQPAYYGPEPSRVGGVPGGVAAPEQLAAGFAGYGVGQQPAAVPPAAPTAGAGLMAPATGAAVPPPAPAAPQIPTDQDWMDAVTQSGFDPQQVAMDAMDRYAREAFAGGGWDNQWISMMPQSLAEPMMNYMRTAMETGNWQNEFFDQLPHEFKWAVWRMYLENMGYTGRSRPRGGGGRTVQMYGPIW